MSNSVLAKRLVSAKATNATLRREKGDLKAQALHHVIGMGGGIVGALARKYLPGMVPGTAGDQFALLTTTFLLDGLTMYFESPELLALSLGYEGKVVGDAFEVAMGWRASPEQA